MRCFRAAAEFSLGETTDQVFLFSPVQGVDT